MLVVRHNAINSILGARRLADAFANAAILEGDSNAIGVIETGRFSPS